MTDTRQIILHSLQDAGWQPARLPALATREFETAVGLRRAVIYLTPANPQDPNRCVLGEYLSEGINILASSGRLIPRDADEQTISDIAEAFRVDVELAISRSYAVRLLGRPELASKTSPPDPFRL